MADHTITIDNEGTYAVDDAGVQIIRRFLARAYVFGRGSTHWDGCELAHHECALLKLERSYNETKSMLSRAQASEQELKRIRSLLKEALGTNK